MTTANQHPIYPSKRGVCASVCRGPETKITFKIVPPNSRAQKLFKTSITHFYFFTYRVPTNPGPKSQHPGFKLLTGVPTVKEPNSKKNLAQAGRRLGVWNRGNKY
jgi:hypothetical protein